MQGSAVAVNVIAHGYLDILVALPLLLALRALEDRRAIQAGASYGARAPAVCTGPVV